MMNHVYLPLLWSALCIPMSIHRAKKSHIYILLERGGAGYWVRVIDCDGSGWGKNKQKSMMDLWFNHLAAVGHACCCLGNYHGCLIERELFGVRNERVNKTTHDFHHGFCWSPLWFLHLRWQAHIPHERGGAPDVLEFCESEFRWWWQRQWWDE